MRTRKLGGVQAVGSLRRYACTLPVSEGGGGERCRLVSVAVLPRLTLFDRTDLLLECAETIKGRSAALSDTFLFLACLCTCLMLIL